MGNLHLGKRCCCFWKTASYKHSSQKKKFLWVLFIGARWAQCTGVTPDVLDTAVGIEQSVITACKKLSDITWLDRTHLIWRFIEQNSGGGKALQMETCRPCTQLRSETGRYKLHHLGYIQIFKYIQPVE